MQMSLYACNLFLYHLCTLMSHNPTTSLPWIQTVPATLTTLSLETDSSQSPRLALALECQL